MKILFVFKTIDFVYSAITTMLPNLQNIDNHNTTKTYFKIDLRYIENLCIAWMKYRQNEEYNLLIAVKLIKQEWFLFYI